MPDFVKGGKGQQLYHRMVSNSSQGRAADLNIYIARIICALCMPMQLTLSKMFSSVQFVVVNEFKSDPGKTRYGTIAQSCNGRK